MVSDGTLDLPDRGTETSVGADVVLLQKSRYLASGLLISDGGRLPTRVQQNLTIRIVMTNIIQFSIWTLPDRREDQRSDSLVQ